MKLTLKAKLIGLFMLLGFLPFIAIGMYAYSTSTTAMKQGAFNQLTAIREIKANQIKDYFSVMRGQLKALKDDPHVLKAMIEFNQAFENAGDTIDSEAWRSAAETYELRLKDIMHDYAWHDIFLIHNDGDVVYTVTRESDLGMIIPDSDLRHSGLGRAYAAAKAAGPDDIVFIDFSPYAPSNDEPAAFMMAQMRDDREELKGYVAFQLKLNKINHIMQERNGMGETGETYLVGENKRMRSDSAMSANHTVSASFGGDIETNGVDTQALRLALAGQKDVGLFKDYRGETVLSAFAPIEINGVRWVIIAQIDQTEAFASVYRLRRAVLIFGGVAAILIVAVGWLMANSISNPLNEIINTIASSSTQISATVVEQERTAAQQASSVEETSATMDELGRSSSQSSHQAEEASQAAQNALEMVESGSVTASQTSQGMVDLTAKVDAIAEQILQLSEQTSQIGAITNLVSDIANQTNMLALNAAVEAARAGEHGKGFAVVAAEIRKLADESKKSAAKINTLVEDIQKATNSTVMVTEEGAKTVDASIALTEKTAQAFEKISASIDSNSDSVQQIALNIQQQASAVQQVVTAMNSINTGAKETAAGLGDTKTGVETLHEASNRLKALV